MSHQLQTNSISPRLLGDTMKIGVKMYRWWMMVWLKGENCMKQLQEMVRTYIYQNPQEKQSLHQISYQRHGCLVGNIYMSIQIHMSIVCETQHKTIIRRNNGDYIFDILHMIQNPHLLVGSSHLTIKSLQAIKQVVSFTPCGRLFQILKPW